MHDNPADEAAIAPSQKELEINKDDARSMIQELRRGIIDRRPRPP